MKKLLSIISLAILLVTLTACNDTKDRDANTLVVGASNIPHAIILEKAKSLLKEKGYELVVETYQDYVLPNEDLSNGTLDANYFQHIPYLQSQNNDFGYGFVNAGGIHIEPMGLYSQKYTNLNELPKGALVLLSSSIADHGRVLAILESEGVIKLKEGIDRKNATFDDIVENHKELVFEYDIEAALLPEMYLNNEADIIAINSNYALDAGLNPIEDSIAMEGADSPYVNIIAVRNGDENKEIIKALIEVLRSKEIHEFILNEYNGAVVPVQ